MNRINVNILLDNSLHDKAFHVKILRFFSGPLQYMSLLKPFLSRYSKERFDYDIQSDIFKELKIVTFFFRTYIHIYIY